jgi:hypothetical protein
MVDAEIRNDGATLAPLHIGFWNKVWEQLFSKYDRLIDVF